MPDRLVPSGPAGLVHDPEDEPLPGLPGRAGFESGLAELLDSAGPQVALLLVDLDGFAVVREGLGFDAADEVLAGAARTLRATFRGHQALFAHLPGDVLAIALRGAYLPAAVEELAERILGDLAKPVYVDGVGVGLSASIGAFLTDTNIDTDTDTAGRPAGAVRSAQIALRRAKELGHTRWVLSDPVSAIGDGRRYRLACGIAGALDSGELTVVYRPHVVLPDGAIATSLNAVLRWHHPVLGELRAEQFFPLAETTGMTVALGRYLLAESLRAAGGWRARFADAAPMVCLTLPRRMAIDGDLVRIVEDELARNDLGHRHLMLCTDAPSLVDDRGELLDSLGELARAGVVFVVDITGLAELELLPALAVPAPAVMLTGAMIDALEVDEPPAEAVRAIRQLVERAEELDIKVGAHGVLSEEHARLLSGIGVVVGSGPYLPLHATAEEAEVWAGRNYPMG
ncbi:EAL domain-containing protein [Amycolatopsis sp. PS_44_ISF1]|uniref:EAL domain-containing protein n=1 Tax=Amycolatopsis sp. PS_44_ISF1 TaxID=2974917 RepID=UPI0028DFDF4F|nr:EAL domain-containing protein [Amycolatopsis sp. PS_44_ISF1]MDT8914243.1 EAL domain-containing protein [Amycolatopsis sp. PS_44_ISF1]